MAEIPVTFLLNKLGTFLIKEAQLLGGMGREIEEIREQLENIQAFLKDADIKKNRSEGIKTWVKQVRRVAYDVEDVIDEFVLRFERRNEGGGFRKFFNNLLCGLKQLPSSLDLANSVQSTKRTIIEISERRRMYDIQMIDEGKSSDAALRQWEGHKETTSLDQVEIIGIENKVDVLVEQLVTGNDEKTFISIVGMGGLGKTTLVRRVYNEPKVKAHFNCGAWVSVSQSFNTRDLLKSMLLEFGNTKEQNYQEEANESMFPSRKEIEKMSEVDLAQKLERFLSTKKFILVLDDVWNKEAVKDINFALPEIANGSKIMITTRIESVASELMGTIRSGSFIRHELEYLNDDVAMDLLCRKTFPGPATMPEDLKGVAQSMLRSCGGLPLAIVALGGILREKKTVAKWEKVHKNLSELLGNSGSSSRDIDIRSILKFSYDELPFHLKPCFLYCGLFPEDHLIKRNKLIRLWVSEGFIEEGSGLTAEEVGEKNLMQLIGRNMLQIVDTSIDGRVKSCRIHDLMHDLAISISQEEEFFFKLNTQVRNTNVIKPRRMSIVAENKEKALSSTPSIQLLRSLLFFRVNYVKIPDPISRSGLKLLRVLHLEGVRWMTELPNQITQLLHLRYLSLKGNGWLTQLPRSIGNLQNLETLDIRATAVHELPNGISKLTNLRHLCTDGIGFSSDALARACSCCIGCCTCMLCCTCMPCCICCCLAIGLPDTYTLGSTLEKQFDREPRFWQVPKGISNLRCLQTLTGVRCSTNGIAAEIGKLKELRKLDIECDPEADTEVAKELCAAIRSMTHLLRLRMSPATFGMELLENPPSHLRILDLIGLSEWPRSLGSFGNLIVLRLQGGRLTEDPFPSLSSLPSLLHLQLYWLINVEQLKCPPRSFQKLQRLQLDYMPKLKTVTFDESSMSKLKQLVIADCPKLQMLPQGIQDIQLQELIVGNMPPAFTDRLGTTGEDFSKVQHIPLVKCASRHLNDEAIRRS